MVTEGERIGSAVTALPRMGFFCLDESNHMQYIISTNL